MRKSLKAAKKLNLPKSTLSDIKVHKLAITAKTRKKFPKYVRNQEQRAESGLRKIYNETRKKTLIIDDETYVILNPKETPGRKFVHALDHNQLEFHHKLKPVTKFPDKILVWQAIDEIGNVSELYFTKGTINQDIYLNECLKKQLLPFILQHHELNDILFWPDLATTHYANQVQAFFREKSIPFVEKVESPPRGIETFWAQCKEEYSNQSTEPKN